MERWANIWEQMLVNDGRATLYALGAIALLTLFELSLPAEPNQSWRSRGRNLIYLLVLKVLGISGIAAWYAWGPTLPPPSWVIALEITPAIRIGLIALNLLAIDILYYGYHRAQHHFTPLWAIHELHHSDTELNATSSYRTYWLEAPVQTILVMTPTLLLFGGLGPVHGYSVLFFSLFFLIISHTNIRLELGPFSGWVIGPQVHRIHHSRLPGHRDQNFAQYFPFLDRLFGTFYPPSPGEFPPTGVEEIAGDAPISTVMVRPFRIWLDGLRGR